MAMYGYLWPWLLIVSLSTDLVLDNFQASDASGGFTDPDLRAAVKKAVDEKCDIINMSFGLNYATPYPPLASLLKMTADADTIVTAAAGNRVEAGEGTKTFDIASPSASENAISVANLNNTANPGKKAVRRQGEADTSMSCQVTTPDHT